jgi:hypothetical protein
MFPRQRRKICFYFFVVLYDGERINASKQHCDDTFLKIHMHKIFRSSFLTFFYIIQ